MHEIFYPQYYLFIIFIFYSYRFQFSPTTAINMSSSKADEDNNKKDTTHKPQERFRNLRLRRTAVSAAATSSTIVSTPAAQTLATTTMDTPPMVAPPTKAVNKQESNEGLKLEKPSKGKVSQSIDTKTKKMAKSSLKTAVTNPKMPKKNLWSDDDDDFEPNQPCLRRDVVLKARAEKVSYIVTYIVPLLF